MYYMWSEKTNLTDLRNLDTIVREAMNRNRAKYKLQMNASLYLTRNKGGRGLKGFETMYKETKVKATMRLAADDDERMLTVKLYDLNRKDRNRSSLIKDGISYALNDFNITLTMTPSSFEASKKTAKDIQQMTEMK